MLRDKVKEVLNNINIEDGEDYVVIVFRDYEGDNLESFLVNTSDHSICKSFQDVRDTYIKDFINIDLSYFDVLEDEDDNIFNTEYSVIPLQCSVEDVSLKHYDVNFAVYSSFVVEARTKEEAEEEFYNISKKDILERLADDLSGIEVGTVEEV